MEIINYTNGNFNLNSEMILAPNLEFKKVSSFEIQKHSVDMSNGYEWIYFRNLKIQGFYFFINVCFFRKKIKNISFTFFEEQPKESSWENWSEKEELNHLRKLENWLEKSIGSKRKFNWGTISTHYDSKAGNATVLINYSL